ncbi:MAG: hypothetical protein KF757_02175 [Phycisphaeraceae bacterium]|nr:hypothetical protein [Phycisphaeraceae bacterium]MCW5762019.1 hypothetical protein [Phycisphaeraceae bacterium]
MSDLAIYLGGVPAQLREELLSAYTEIVHNYYEHRWEPAELNGGKFCEIVYSILRGHADGAMPGNATKPSNMVDACRALERETSLPRGFRILISRMLPVLYEIRNNRGVGHVGGEVDANQMDATAVIEMSSWVMAELIRVFHATTTKAATAAVSALVDRRVPLVWATGDVRRVLNPAMKAKDQTLVLLYSSAKPVALDDLVNWIEYSNKSLYKKNVILQLHQNRLVEFNDAESMAVLTPLGAKHVETTLLKNLQPGG